MINCTNIKKSYGKKTIIEDTNVQFESNKISFIMGANGTGKTTFIKCVAGLEDFNGNVFFDEKDIDSIRSDFLVIWDDCPFYINLSGYDNLFLLSNSLFKKNDIWEAAKLFMSEEKLNSKVKNYSYGEKKRLSLALVHLNKPKYLIMDEVTNGLDYDTISLLKKIIPKWAESMTMILTGHNLAFYNEIIDDLYLIENNRIFMFKTEFNKNDINLEEIYENELHK